MESVLSFLKWLKWDKEDIADVRFLTEYEKMWSFVGLCPHQGASRSSLHFIYPRFVMGLSGYVALVACGIDLCLNSTDIFVVTENLCLMACSAMVIVKSATFVARPRDIAALVATLEALHAGQRRDDPTVRAMLREAQLASKVFSTYLAIPLTGGVVVMVVVLFGAAWFLQQLPFRAWFPCDSQNAGCFLVKSLYEAMITFVQLHTIGIADAIFFDFLAQLLIQFKILRYKLDTLGDILPKIDPTQHGTDQETSSEDSVMEPFDLAQSGCRGGETRRASAGRRGGRRENAFVNWRVRAKKKAKRRRKYISGVYMERRLASCAQHHQILLRFANGLQSCFNNFILIQILFNLVVISGMAMKNALVAYYSVKEACMFVVGLCILAELYVMCWLSNQITQESEGVRDSLYSSNSWFDMSDGFKRSMRIVISRANVPVVIQAAGFIPLSMEVFNNVTKTAYSYLMVMLSLAKNNLEHTSRES